MYITDSETVILIASPGIASFLWSVTVMAGECTLICRTKKLHWLCRGVSMPMFVHKTSALDIAEIPTWVIMSPSPVAAAPPNPLEA